MTTRRQALVSAVGLLGLPAWGQDGAPIVPGFPNRPMRMILPLGPGSSGDVNSRFIAEKLAARLGQPVVPENRPGGEMQIALQALLSAPADGHALLFISPSSMVVNPVVVENWSIDVRKRVRPLILSTRAHTVYVTRTTSPFQTVGDALAAARANPGAVSVGNFSRYYESAATALGRKGKAQFNHVTYKGATQMLTDVIGGSVDIALTDITSVLQLVEGGKLRALGVNSAVRLPGLPQVPTVREQGFPDHEFSIWVGYGVRSETPEPLANLLASSLMAIVRSSEFSAFNKANGSNEIVAMDGAGLARQIDRETEQLRASLASR